MGTVGPDFGAHCMAKRPVQTCLPFIWILQKRNPIARGRGDVCPPGVSGETAGFTELRESPPVPWQKGRRYPWTTGERLQSANTSDPDIWPRAAPAGATRQGVNGLYDMGANVWEWTTDSPDSKGRERRTVGGSWWYGPFNMKADVQAFKPADFYAVYIGFRCLYDR